MKSTEILLRQATLMFFVSNKNTCLIDSCLTAYLVDANRSKQLKQFRLHVTECCETDGHLGRRKSTMFTYLLLLR